MTDTPDSQKSAQAISIEIGLELSYFTDESERNFTGLEIVIGYLLLEWFAEGVVKGMGEATGEAIARKAPGTVARLGKRVKAFFGRSKRTPQADTAEKEKLAAEAQQALTKASKALTANDDAAKVTEVANAYELALVGYLTDTGMPAKDATRIAQRVRAETQKQLKIPPQEEGKTE